jgi:polyphosphate kinase
MKKIDRDISWLYFNSRLLQEAESKDNDIITRIKFLGIYSNNLDEFYRVRVATLNRIIDFNRKKYPDKLATLLKTREKIDELIRTYQIRFTDILEKSYSELESSNVFVINESQLTGSQSQIVKEYFEQKVLPELNIINLTKNTKDTSLKDGSIYLAVILKKNKEEDRIAYSMIEVPANRIERYFVFPKQGKDRYIIRLDDIIRTNLARIFNVFSYKYFEAYTFKITRDAEIDLPTDVSKSFIDIVSESIKQRKTGSALRFVYDCRMPEHLFIFLFDKLNVRKKDYCFPGGRYHNSKDLMKFPEMLKSEPKFVKPSLLPHRHITEGNKLLAAIRKNDILLYFPYHSFDNTLNLLRESSIDPMVRSIKITLYRLAEESHVINTLINAANNGKYVTVFLELTARFEEEQNIYWTNKLSEAGVKVIKTIPGIKVHSKLILIRTREKQSNFYYTNISTGNFNENTAKIYCDFSLFTANQNLAIEVGKVFYLLESAYQIIKFDHLIVSPIYTRNAFISLIDNEIVNAKNKAEAWVDIKLNSLTDKEMVDKICEAADAGVKVRINARAICTLIPINNPNIKTIGIVDRFLEHARLFIFCNGGDNKYYIGSSDWMPRNLDNRIEVTTPIYDKNIQKELRAIFDLQFKDNVKARDWSSESGNLINNSESKKVIRSQIEIFNYLKNIHNKKKQ